MARHPRPSERWPSAATADNRDPGATRCGCEGQGVCWSCGQRRRHAWRLVELKGLSFKEAAERMQLTPGRVRVLVAQQRDKREVAKHRCNQIECTALGAFVKHELARNPDLSVAELAHFLDVRQLDLERQLGYKPGKNGKFQRHVDVATASRIVIALGRAPHELDGC